MTEDVYKTLADVVTIAAVHARIDRCWNKCVELMQEASGTRLSTEVQAAAGCLINARYYATCGDQALAMYSLGTAVAHLLRFRLIDEQFAAEMRL